MTMTILLAVSIGIQVTAAVLSLRLVRLTGYRSPWILIAAALALMACRRSITLVRVLAEGGPRHADPAAEWVALAISVLIAAGIARVAPLVRRGVVANAELRESEEKFRTLTESSPVGMFLDDAEGNAVYINDRCAELVGLPAEDALDLDWVPAIHPDDRERVTSRWAAAVAAREPFCEEYRWVHDDGRVVWTRGDVVPVLDADGNVVVFIGTLVDVTDRVRAEEELKRLNVELETRVAERTAELAGRVTEADRLNRAMLNLLEDLKAQRRRTEEVARQLEVTNRELESFAYSVSHDLRAPLRAIDGFGEALEEELGDGLEKRQKDYLQRMQAAAGRMDGMINDLLELSRASRVEMQRREVDMSALARQVIEELRAGEPGRTVEIDVQPGLKAHGDPRLLRLVLQNLIGNAWKFTAPREAARIEVGRLDAAEEDVEEGVFFVKDDGVGFDMRYAGKLFGAFQRLHQREEFPGTGIGLATVQRIVHRHGGRVWAEAEPGAGATFFFTLGERSAS